MINCETIIYNQDYTETQNLREIIANEKKIVDCVYIISGDICVVSIITEPIYFISELRKLTNAVAVIVSDNTNVDNIYVTRDTDIYCDIVKLGKSKTDKERNVLTQKIINKVTKRAYEND